MNSRTNIMFKPRSGKLQCAHASSDGCLTFHYQHCKSLLLQRNCSGKSIGPRPDNYGVVVLCAHELYKFLTINATIYTKYEIFGKVIAGFGTSRNSRINTSLVNGVRVICPG